MTRQPTLVNVIAGPLGSGKTTLINHLLTQRPEGARWAVLVNEYGLVGLDAALMTPTSDVEVRELAGGCICCTSGVAFEMTLVRLLRQRPDRLLIEPTGLAKASGILETLHAPGISKAVDVQSVTCILDPRRLDASLAREDVQDQVRAADILLASRPDLASERELAAFYEWARAQRPAKARVGEAPMGRVDLATLAVDDVRAADGAPESIAAATHLHGHDHDHGHNARSDGHECDAARPIVRRHHFSEAASTLGWICWDELVFDAARVTAWLDRLARTPGTRRVKAVLRTDSGWLRFNLVDGGGDAEPHVGREDSRIELVIEGANALEPEACERQLRMCLVNAR